MFPNKIIDYFYLNLILLFIYIPIVSLVIFSFNQGEGRIASLVIWNKFSLQWYIKIFKDPAVKNAIFTTFKIAFFSTLISVIIGTFASIALTQSSSKWQKIILNFNQLSFIIPEIIIGLSLFVFFGLIGLKNNFLKMLLAHVSFSLPYMLITIFPQCRSFQTNWFEVAYDLGATPLQTIIKVILPQLKSAIYASIGLAFTLSFDDFIVSYFVGGTNYQNISSYIYSLKGTINPAINALSSILISLIFLRILFKYFKLRKDVKSK